MRLKDKVAIITGCAPVSVKSRHAYLPAKAQR